MDQWINESMNQLTNENRTFKVLYLLAGTYTLPGGIATSMLNGQAVTMSTYTRIVNGVATYGTVTIGSMQTYYQGKLLQPGDNIYGVPNVGTYTLPGTLQRRVTHFAEFSILA